MKNESKCPKCGSGYVYTDGNLWICPECAHEWSNETSPTEAPKDESRKQVILDAHGNVLKDGDSVIVVKDLRIKGSSSSVKVGTKVKKIRLIESEDGHNISCKIDGFGAINLKSEFVKKA